MSKADQYLGMPNVEFDFAAAETLASVAASSAGSVRSLQTERSNRAVTAQADFRGYFANLFADNIATGTTDGNNLATCLDKLARYTRQLITAAEEENQRRQHAREWAERQKRREENLLVDIYYNLAFWESKDPQPYATQPAPAYSAGDINLARHDLPTRGGGGGGGVSSANPQHLRGFALPSTWNSSFESDGPGRLRRAWNSFVSGCSWGTLDAASTVDALDQWIAANIEERSWATAVAAAFEAAGTDGGVASLADASLLEALAQAGLDPVRGTIALDPPELYGINPTTGYSNDPVNTATGNFIEPECDLAFSGAGSALRLTRMYNSQSRAAGLFGLGWVSSLETRLVLDGGDGGDGGPSFVMEDGREIRFPRLADEWSVRAEVENYWLEALAGADTGASPDSTFDAFPVRAAAFVVSSNSGTRWAFDAAGAWLGTSAGPGTAVTAVRDAEGRVQRMRHERGREISIVYRDGLVHSAATSDGRDVEYLYDERRRLVGARSAIGTRGYRWNDEDLISAVVSAAGVTEAENVYDDEARVVRQTTEFGREVRFAYLPGRVTSVSDTDGANGNTWIADRRGRLTGVIDGDGARMEMRYDRFGNRISVVDRDGSRTEHEYDGRGRLTLTKLPTGGEVTQTYDDFDRVVRVVTSVCAGYTAGRGATSGEVVCGTVEYGYANDSDRDPSVIRDAAGGETALLWRDGLLLRVVDPTGVRVEMAYDEHGDLIATTNGAGDTARIERDGSGRVVVAVSPSGNRTEYRYDETTGLLAERRDADGARWRFEHTAAGKLAAVTDPLGGRSAFEYGPHGELVRAVDSLGRATEREFDVFGNLASLHLPDGSDWLYEHDALSRLRGLTDPNGNRWSVDYDAAGRVTERRSPEGVGETFARSRVARTTTAQLPVGDMRTANDEFGRLQAASTTDGGESVIAYDSAGRPVEIVDVDGGLTTLGYDLAGRVTGVTTAAGRITRYEYDACGRLARTIDPAGAEARYEYDADSRVLAVAGPAGETARFEYDPMGRVVRREVAGEGVTRSTYDALGRVVFTQDARHGQRRFGYDAAGQLTTATNGLGGTTHFDYDARGRLVATTDPLGGVTRRTYNELDRVTSITDPLGRTTRATYDADGRQLTQTDPDGHVTEWRYDERGAFLGTNVDGVAIAHVTRDARSRVLTVHDSSRGGDAVTHTLRFDRGGRLVERARGARSMRWEYDADGLRRAMIDADGARIEYEHDAAGRLTSVRHPSLGELRYEYDAFGRVASLRTADAEQVWEYEHGLPVRHTLVDASGALTTVISRDPEGRVRRVQTGDAQVEYGYDAACQLVSARETSGAGGAGSAETQWRYDAAGRLVEERVGAALREFAYDAAGQLLAITTAGGSRCSFDYDGAGRRVAMRSGDKTTEYEWDARGWLAAVTRSAAGGSPESRVRVWVDALGELASVSGSPVWWDSASGLPSPVAVGDAKTFGGAGFTGLAGHAGGAGDTDNSGGEWIAAGWRPARSSAADDPWRADGSSSRLTGDVAVTASGGVVIAGLEWMGARVYDPAARGFLTVDPLSPIAGTAWSANPYSFAGNDPVHALDPLGLRPVTDAELRAYAETRQGAINHVGAAIGDWWNDNWEYVAAGAMIVAGVALMFTGVGGPAGIALMAGSGALLAGGISTVSQKAQTGAVDWGRVGTDALIGGVMGAAGGGAAMAAKSLAGGTTSAVRALTVNAAVNGGVGGVGGGVGYLARNDWQIRDGWDFAGNIAGGSVAGAVGGVGGPAGGTLANRLGYSSTGWQSMAITSGISGVGSAGGSVVSDVVSGDEINWGGAALSGAAGAGSSALSDTGAGLLKLDMRGTSTLSQMPYFHPRTTSGAFDFSQVNTRGLWGSAVLGTTVGEGADLLMSEGGGLGGSP